MSCRFLLQRIFLTQGLNLRLLHWQVDSLPPSRKPHSFFTPYKKRKQWLFEIEVFFVVVVVVVVVLNEILQGNEGVDL